MHNFDVNSPPYSVMPVFDANHGQAVDLEGSQSEAQTCSACGR